MKKILLVICSLIPFHSYAIDINQKVYINEQPVLGDSAGDGALGVCNELSSKIVSDPSSPVVKVSGTGIKATFYLRSRCQSYSDHQKIIGSCNAGAPPTSVDSFSPALDPRFGTYQSYRIEECN